MFKALSYAGTFGLVWIVIAALLAVCHRRWGPFALTVIAIVLADASSRGLKALIDRSRPPVRYAKPEPLVGTPHDASFPSGHAATSFAAATMLSLAFPRLRLPLVLLAAAVAFSRVYVGVHYPLDVIGGAALGVLVAAALAVKALRRPAKGRRRQPPATRAG